MKDEMKIGDEIRQSYVLSLSCLQVSMVLVSKIVWKSSTLSSSGSSGEAAVNEAFAIHCLLCFINFFFCAWTEVACKTRNLRHFCLKRNGHLVMLQVWAALCVNVMLLMEGRARSSCGRATRMARSVLLRTASATAETFRLHHQRRGKGAAPCASLPDWCLTQMASSVKTARICALLSMSRASIFPLGYFFLFMSLSFWVWLCHDERRGAFGDCQVLKSKAQFLKVAQKTIIL